MIPKDIICIGDNLTALQIHGSKGAIMKVQV